MIESGNYDLGALVREAGVRCPRCGSGACARRHAVRYRGRVRDLSTGEVFEHLPILRVIFCSGTTASLSPADVWRGRSTVTSVIETATHIAEDGVGAALRWTSYAGHGDDLVSERTLRRWRDLIDTRLIGSAMAWLGPRLDLPWSTGEPQAEQLARFLEQVTLEALVDFRATFGRAVLDTVPPPPPRTQTPPRRIQGRLDPAPPPDPPSELLPRGPSSPRNGRGPPAKNSPSNPREVTR